MMDRDQSMPDELRQMLEQHIRLEFGESIPLADIEGLVPYLARIRAQAGRLRALAISDDPSETFYAVERNVGHGL
jgi:hypothetical protein